VRNAEGGDESDSSFASNVSGGDEDDLVNQRLKVIFNDRFFVWPYVLLS